MRILLVKLSSMGDVVHNLPVATDIRRALPNAQIDWAVEPPFAPLVRLHPAIREVLPIPLRAVKARWWSPAAWGALRIARRDLGTRQYDAILDTQGLVKSAWIAAAAVGPVAGYDASSAREPAVARRYAHTHAVARDTHAVVRNRTLAAAALGYAHPVEVDYGIRADATRLTEKPCVVCLTATSRADKLWAQTRWIALIEHLAARDIVALLPWGNADERAFNEAIAARTANAVIPERMSLDDLAGAIAGAIAVVGVDTGLTHLAVALGRPAVGLYVTTQPGLTGLLGRANAINLGGGTRASPSPPAVDAVWAALQSMLPTSP
jgi:heptosyltransferase-1